MLSFADISITFGCKKQNLMCINAFIDGERQIISLLYSICKGLNSFFSTQTQKKMCLVVRKKPHLSPLLKNGHLQMTLELKARIGNSLCFMQYCSEVWYNDFMQEARSRHIKGSALKSICLVLFFFSRKCYIHSSN